MIFNLTLSDDKGLLVSKDFTWSLGKNPDGTEVEHSGNGTTNVNGTCTIDIKEKVTTPANLVIISEDKRLARAINFNRPIITFQLTLEKVVQAGQGGPRELDDQYDIKNNDLIDWDWMVWETEGNSDPKYQRGGKERKLGLYRINYDLLRKAGTDKWADLHQDGTIGGGWVKVAVLEEFDYSEHAALINTFLPDFKIEGSKVREPDEWDVKEKEVYVSRSDPQQNNFNTLNVQPPYIVMPFNYDDNSPNSKAIGKDLNIEPLGNCKAAILLNELPRWASASRSTITSFKDEKCDLTLNAEKVWKLRPHEIGNPNLPQVRGDDKALSFSKFQNEGVNADKKYYSVKTGVDFVATQDQGVNGKDKLESNSIHAMSRSNLIAGIMKGKSLKAGYQIEILSILLGKDSSWDGIQIREIGTAGIGEVWFPALTIPSHGKAFAEAWEQGCKWEKFWEDNFARPVGRAKAEMMVYFGLQHMTSNAQNFLVSFDRNKGSNAKQVILRDIGDTLLNNEFFDILKSNNGNSALFTKIWDDEIADKENGIVLEFNNAVTTIGGGYSNPQITRIGTGIIFFFPPFLKGDIDVKKDPKNAKIAAQWGVAHNQGFLDYMKEKIGYTDDWLKNDNGIKLEDDLKNDVKKEADLSISGKSAKYAELAGKILTVKSKSRQDLIREIEDEIKALDVVNGKDVDSLQRLVAGHELLICAEIHCYIKSDAGKLAVQALHQ